MYLKTETSIKIWKTPKKTRPELGHDKSNKICIDCHIRIFGRWSAEKYNFLSKQAAKGKEMSKRNFSPRSSSPGSIARQETLIGFEPTSIAGILTLTTKLTVVLVTTLVHFKKIYKAFKTSCQKLPRFSSRPLSRGPSAWGRSSCT